MQNKPKTADQIYFPCSVNRTYFRGKLTLSYRMLTLIQPVWRIRDVYPGPRIPDPTFFHPDSRVRTVSIPDPGSSSKNLSILTPKKAKKWFLSSKKYDPGCSSRIPDPDADFLPSRIPDPGVKKAPSPGSRIRIRNTGYNI
jgi:hypothetical protein